LSAFLSYFYIYYGKSFFTKNIPKPYPCLKPLTSQAHHVVFFVLVVNSLSSLVLSIHAEIDTLENLLSHIDNISTSSESDSIAKQALLQNVNQRLGNNLQNIKIS